MNPEASKRLKLLASVVSVILVLCLLASGWFYWRIRASLPPLAGERVLTGLSQPATIGRDANGVPTIRGANRSDVARALGWAHAQDRFFQMDVLRRSPAGELSELFGKRALPRDRAARMHGFRERAETVVGRLPASQRAVLDAYTAGVNGGLAALGERPFEYLLLRDEPVPWRPADSILVIYAMTMDLQDEEGIYERSLMTLRDHYGMDGISFFAPLVSPDDAALDGTVAPTPPMPGPGTIDLRTQKTGALPARNPAAAGLARVGRNPEFGAGSNAFALAGSLTASGAAMLANDMHLDHGVPNTWYRASLEYEGRTVTGVTLPGTPAVAAGSNGKVAWGFTNAYADTGDLVVVETNSIAATLYKAPGREESLALEKRKATIRIKGADPVTIDYTWSIWGPIVGTNERQRPLAHRWVPHDPAATDLGLLDMERTGNVREALAVAHRVGIPAQNILLADADGAVAWTIAGRLPKRVGYDGRLPVTWTFGDRTWDGYLSSGEIPVVVSHSPSGPAEMTAQDGRIWSANHRHVGGDALARIGDGAYARATRARQIRDALAGIAKASPKDLLALQLDDRALFLERWHRLLMETLTPEVITGKKARTAMRTFAEKWEGRASTEAVSYRLVREFRTAVYHRVFAPIFAPCLESFSGFDFRHFHLEPAVWALLQEKPAHLLSPEFANWDELLVAAIEDTIRAVDKQGVALPRGNWGWRNRARIGHPFSYSFPWLAGWLDMPADPLPGDADMPRVQSPGHGASERLVVSPGREQEGIFHMPGGQSGHPFSPFYRAGHDAWVRGDPTPFLPGNAVHTLTLKP